jgi:ATP-dependent DNA ligase
LALSIATPFEPMEAELVRELPAGSGWLYEPKWDGFRCVAFRDGVEVRLQSKSGQDLTRYFPEAAEMLKGLKVKRFVLDGELVVPVEDVLSFDEPVAADPSCREQGSQAGGQASGASDRV